MKRIKTGDSVKITTGALKGTIAEVGHISGNNVYLKGIKTVERHYRATPYNQGGKRDIQLPIDISNVALVVDGEKTSRVAYQVNDDKSKVRVAKATGKEIK